MKKNKIIKKAIVIMGSAKNLAIACDVSESCVSHWLYETRYPAIKACIKIKKIVGCSFEEIRNDIPWDDLID